MLHLSLYNAIVVLKVVLRHLKKRFKCLHQMVMLLFHHNLHNLEYIITNGQLNKHGQQEYQIKIKIIKYREI